MPPFSPEGVVKEFCSTLARYRVFAVKGDRYAGLWPREQFSKGGWRPDLRQAQERHLQRLTAGHRRRLG